jgi:hypothetical protein
MIVAMEQEKNLKDGIVAAVVEQLLAFKGEIIQGVDTKLQSFKGEVDKQLLSFKEHVDTRFRHQGVILEDIQDNVKIIAEGQDFLHSKVDRLEDRVTVLEQNQI